MKLADATEDRRGERERLDLLHDPAILPRGIGAHEILPFDPITEVPPGDPLEIAIEVAALDPDTAAVLDRVLRAPQNLLSRYQHRAGSGDRR